MMRFNLTSKKLFPFVLLLLPFCSFGQLSEADYMRQKDVISFDSIAKYVTMMRLVDGKYGFQNVLGEWLIPAEYDWIETKGGEIRDFPAFHGMQVFVKKGQLMGVVALGGKVIIPCSYAYITDEGDSYTVSDGKNRVATFAKDGKQLSPFAKLKEQSYEQDYYINDYSGYRYRDYTIQGADWNSVLKLKQTPYHVQIGRESEGFTSVFFYVVTDGADGGIARGVYGYLNNRGKWAIAPRFSAKNYHESANGPAFNADFRSGRALIWENEHDFRYIDTLGNTVFAPDTTLGTPHARPFNSMGYCVVEYYKSYGGHPETVYYNTDGSERLRILPTQSIMTTPNGATSPEVYWGHLSVYDSQTKEYTFYDSTLTRIAYRFSIADSLSLMKGKKLSPHFSSYAIALTKHRKDKMATKIIDWDGKVLSDWSPSTKTYDVLTDVYVVRSNGGIQLVKGATKEVLYSCDSCVSSHGYDLQHWGSGYETTYGIFQIWDRHAATKGDLSEVNYKGEVIYRKKYVPEKPYSYSEKEFRPGWNRIDLAMQKQPRTYDQPAERSPRPTPFQLTQADFDSLYVALGWTKFRAVKKPVEKIEKPVYQKKDSKGRPILEFIPPVVMDDKEE